MSQGAPVWRAVRELTQAVPCGLDFHPNRAHTGSEPMYAVTDNEQFGDFEETVAGKNGSGPLHFVAHDASGGERLYGDDPSKSA